MKEENFYSIVSFKIIDSKDLTFNNYIHFKNGGKLNVDNLSKESVLILTGEIKKGNFTYRYLHNIHGSDSIHAFLEKFRKHYVNIYIDGRSNQIPIILKSKTDDTFSDCILNF